MGGTASKHQETQNGWNAFLSRSVSVPTIRNQMKDECAPKISWKSRLFSMPRSDNRGKDFTSDGMLSKLKPVKEEEVELDLEEYPEAFSMHDSVADLDRKTQVSTAGAFYTKSGRLLNRSMTFQPVLEAESQHRLTVPCKSFKEDRRGRGIRVMDPSFTSSSLSHLRNLSSMDSMDGTTGLRLLLNPVLPPSQTFASPTRGASFKKTLSLKGSFNFRCGDDSTARPLPRKGSISKGVCCDDVPASESEWMTTAGTLTEPDVPLFDPSILATFEKAVEDLSDDGWQSSEVSTSKNILSSFETRSDADSPKLPEKNAPSLRRSESLSSRVIKERPVEHAPKLRAIALLNRKPSFSKVFSLKNDKREWSRQDYLDRFERISPPGCEGKIVLYFTSLRGVRKTFEDCFMLRLILKGLRIHIDERDIWMHSKFRQELTDVMGTALSVPRLFIMGRYIGGADEVELLHEEGILAKLVEGLPKECRQVCKVCADVRFIPCTVCRGSRKTISLDDAIVCCSKCNENGLIMCPLCD